MYKASEDLKFLPFNFIVFLIRRRIMLTFLVTTTFFDVFRRRPIATVEPRQLPSPFAVSSGHRRGFTDLKYFVIWKKILKLVSDGYTLIIESKRSGKYCSKPSRSMWANYSNYNIIQGSFEVATDPNWHNKNIIFTWKALYLFNDTLVVICRRHGEVGFWNVWDVLRIFTGFESS